MPVLEWDKLDERTFELGVDHGVFYPFNPTTGYGTGVVWNGLISVNEKDTGGEDNKQYADNIAYANIRSAAEFEADVEAFTYPDGLAECDGSAEPEEGVYVGQQNRKPFGFSYRTRIGNSGDDLNYGYKIHLVYGATPQPSDRSRDTINEDPEAQTFTWTLKAEKVPVTGLQPTAHLIIDSTKVPPAKLAIFEGTLYGTAGGPGTSPKLPSPDEVIAAFTTLP